MNEKSGVVCESGERVAQFVLVGWNELELMKRTDVERTSGGIHPLFYRGSCSCIWCTVSVVRARWRYVCICVCVCI